LFGFLADLIGKYISRFLEAKDIKERNKAIIPIFGWSVVFIVSVITYIPKGTSPTDAILAIVVFFLILYFVLRILRFFKIL
tara:strand:+ start:220 stop:462 length:243 start_codon:yes stop_codon:yes gene_type:complete